MYFQVCSNSAYPQNSGERYRTIGPLVSSFAEIMHDRTQEKLQIITRCIFGKCTDCNVEFVSFVHWCYMVYVRCSMVYEYLLEITSFHYLLDILSKITGS